MDVSQLKKILGGVLVVGSIGTVIGWILQSIMFPLYPVYSYYGSPWLLVQLVILADSILLLGGLTGVMLGQLKEAGMLGFIAFLLTFIGGVAALCVSFTMVQFLPWLYENTMGIPFTELPLHIQLYYYVANGAFAFGAVLLALMITRAKVFPFMTVILVAFGAMLIEMAVVSFNVRLEAVGFGLFCAGFTWIGILLLFSKTAP